MDLLRDDLGMDGKTNGGNNFEMMCSKVLQKGSWTFNAQLFGIHKPDDKDVPLTLTVSFPIGDQTVRQQKEITVHGTLHDQGDETTMIDFEIDADGLVVPGHAEPGLSADPIGEVRISMITTLYVLTVLFVLSSSLTAVCAITGRSPLRFVGPFSVALSVFVAYCGVDALIGTPKPASPLPLWHGPVYGECGATVIGAEIGRDSIWLMLDEDGSSSPRVFSYVATPDLARGLKRIMTERSPSTASSSVSRSGSRRPARPRSRTTGSVAIRTSITVTGTTRKACSPAVTRTALRSRSP